MIYAELANEFRSLFKRLPDRKIALWFDEKREFERLLPGVEAYLQGLTLPPFVLLRYDEAAGHGQLWIKHEIHWASRNLPAPQKEALRYVVYLPLPPERLDGPEQDGGWSYFSNAAKRRSIYEKLVSQYSRTAIFLSCSFTRRRISIANSHARRLARPRRRDEAA